MAHERDLDALTEPGPGVRRLRGGVLVEGGGAGAIREALAAGDPLWVDLDASRDEEWVLLQEIFRFHPLTIEDTRSPQGRVKLEEHEGYLFIVVRGVSLATSTPDPYDLETTNLYLYLGPKFLVTVHEQPMQSVITVGERLRLSPEPMSRGLDYIAYMVIDTLVDLYFPLLDEIDNFVDELEDSILMTSGDDLMARVLDLKRTVLALRRHLAAMREVMGSLSGRPLAALARETQIYFRDVYDHVVRQLDSVETYRDLLAGVMDMHMSVISNRTNEVIKALSIVATLVLPPTLLAGIYGMNFEWMPWLHSPGGFWYALAGMLALSLGFLAYLWWKRWI